MSPVGGQPERPVAGGSAVRITGAWLVGPNACFIGTAKVPDPGKDEFLAADLSWPSDHKAVVAEVVVE